MATTIEGNIKHHRLTQMDIARANAERLDKKRQQEGLVLQRVDHKTWVYVKPDTDDSKKKAR